MGTRAYQPKRDDYVPEGTEVLDDHPAQIAREQLIPRIAARNRRAIKTIPTSLYFFPKLKAGRRCSCFDIEVAPDSLCLCCFGTGEVGGYGKFGTELITIDITHENINSANVLPDYSVKRKPTPFALVDGVSFGFIETTIRFTPNVGEIDSIFAITDQRDGSLDSYIRSPADSDFVLFTKENLTQRLFNDEIRVRIEFRRPSAISRSPLFSCLHIRYKRLTDLVVLSNIPRTQKSNMLTDLGVTDEWQTQQFWLDNTIKAITTEDFFADVDGLTRWKIHQVEEFAPNNQLVSWDCYTRLIHPYEPYSKVPL